MEQNIKPTLLGDRIAKARISRGLSQQQFAHRLGVNKSTILNWENERSTPRSNRLNHIAGMLNVPLAWLLAGERAGETVEFDPPNMDETRIIEHQIRNAEELTIQLSSILVDIRSHIRKLQRELDQEAK